MPAQLISGNTITQLYSYLRSRDASYNDLRVCFQNSGIEPNESFISSSTRNRDKFLEKYVRSLQLDRNDDAIRLVTFIEQIVAFPLGPDESQLVESLNRDGWQVIGTHIVQVGHAAEALIQLMQQGQPIDTIQREWERAKLSVINDPADALTAASSMLEATYKFILHGVGQPPPAHQDMHGLSKAVYSVLNISPDQQTNEDFRTLFQSTINIANGLGSIRTKIGDAHGASPTRGDPLERHASFGINLAGAVCLFLLETYDEKGMNSSAFTRP